MGQEALKALVEELKKAQKTIYLEFILLVAATYFQKLLIS